MGFSKDGACVTPLLSNTRSIEELVCGEWTRVTRCKAISAGAISYGARKVGRVVVIGSATMFEDAWLDKEDNAKLLDFVFSWLTQRTDLEVVHRCDHCIHCQESAECFLRT